VIDGCGGGGFGSRPSCRKLNCNTIPGPTTVQALALLYNPSVGAAGWQAIFYLLSASRLSRPVRALSGTAPEGQAGIPEAMLARRLVPPSWNCMRDYSNVEGGGGCALLHMAAPHALLMAYCVWNWR